MSRNQEVRFSPEEIIGILNHSATPFVLVEGRGDVVWYREFEKDFINSALLFPVGGRETLLKVFKRRREIRIRAAFVADKDMYVFDGVPIELCDVIFTEGYSIENDLLKNSSVVKNIFSEKEMIRLSELKLPLARWFAFCVEVTRRSKAIDMTAHPQNILDVSSGGLSLRSEYLAEIGFSEPCQALVSDILANFEEKFRGKNLAKLYAFVLSKRKTLKDGCRFNDSQLLEISAKDVPSSVRDGFVSKVNSKLVG